MKTMEERIQTCKVCENRKMDLKTGIVCGLTSEKPTFEENCHDFKLDEKEAKHYLQREEETQEASATSSGGVFSPERRGLRGGMVGGLLMMVIALVWFGAGWAAGYIYFYPPVLFVIGLVGLIRGIAQKNISGEKYRNQQ